MHPRVNAPWLVVFAAGLFASATGKAPEGPPRYRQAIYSVYPGDDARTEDDDKWIAKNCKYGLPQRAKNVTALGPTRLLCREGYVLEHSSELRIPLWVCESLNKADLDGNVTGRLKPEPFAPDPRLQRWPHAEKVDYKGSNLARGHMAPDANRTLSKKLKEETYFLSNMVPQAGGKFNSSIWLQLEKRVREWAKQAPCWIVTGILIHEPDEENPEKADGLVPYFAVGKSPVGVPTHMFKIILAEKEQGKIDALAFVFENRSYEKGSKLEDHLRSIEWIEKRAGFDFFPDMPKATVAKLRKATAKELWPVK